MERTGWLLGEEESVPVDGLRINGHELPFVRLNGDRALLRQRVALGDPLRLVEIAAADDVRAVMPGERGLELAAEDDPVVLLEGADELLVGALELVVVVRCRWASWR